MEVRFMSARRYIQIKKFDHWPIRLCKRNVLVLCLIVSIFVFISYNPKNVNRETLVDLRYISSQSQNSDWKFQVHKVCNCSRAQRSLLVPLTLDGGYLESSCSDHATARGPGQKVASYSFYGTVTNRYFNGTEYNVKAVKEMYPGWVIRLYHNISMEIEEESRVLCQIWCDNDHFDVCNTHHLPSTVGDQSVTFGMLWRFFVLASQSQNPHLSFQMHNVCSCTRAEQTLLNITNVPLTLTVKNRTQYLESSCSNHATVRGPGQKIVSYSFFGTVDSDYFNGVQHNVKAVKEMYPGWIMRLYNNLNIDDVRESNVLCQIWCENDHFDMCDVHHLPSPLGNQSTVLGMLWRFYVLGDPLVDVFLVRDLDSVILQREVDAVHNWLNGENKSTWHIMRDHRAHTVPILGGMWGGMNRNLTLTTTLRQRFIARDQQWRWGYDQDLLTEILWPVVQHDMVSHDSYNCKDFYGAQPWPTKRNGTQFVGGTFPWLNCKVNLNECPKKCRPINHPEWIYC